MGIASLVNVPNLHYKIDDNIKCCHQHIFSAQNVLKPWVAFNGPQSPSRLGSRWIPLPLDAFGVSNSVPAAPRFSPLLYMPYYYA